MCPGQDTSCQTKHGPMLFPRYLSVGNHWGHDFSYRYKLQKKNGFCPKADFRSKKILNQTPYTIEYKGHKHIGKKATPDGFPTTKR